MTVPFIFQQSEWQLFLVALVFSVFFFWLICGKFSEGWFTSSGENQTWRTFYIFLLRLEALFVEFGACRMVCLYSLWHCDELATRPGCHPAFTLALLKLSPEDGLVDVLFWWRWSSVGAPSRDWSQVQSQGAESIFFLVPLLFLSAYPDTPTSSPVQKHALLPNSGRWIVSRWECVCKWWFIFLCGPPINRRLVQDVTLPFLDSCDRLQRPHDPECRRSGNRKWTDRRMLCSSFSAWKYPHWL